MKVAVRVPNWIGDSILAVPALVSLKEEYPDAEIWIVSKRWVKDLFLEYPFVQGVLALPDRSSRKSIRGAAQELKSHGFDAGLLLTNSFASAYLFYLARIPQRWGYSKDGRRLLLTKGVKLPSPYETIHQVEYYQRLIAGLGIQRTPPRLTLPVSVEEEERAGNLLAAYALDRSKPLVVLNPGGYFGSAKRWPPQRYAETAVLLQQNWKAEILIIGTSQETPLAEAISQDLAKKPVILTGRTSLRQLAAILSLASLCVTNDSGPMHMANALGVPTVAVFGPTLPEATRPFQHPSAFIHKKAPCWPCSYRDCPFDHRCMLSITAEDVCEISQGLLS